MSKTARRFPPWLKKRLPPPGRMERVHALLERLELHTVCQSAHCPNLCECFARGTATFMILGDVCTRNCTFCAVAGGAPLPLDPGEPERLAEATRELGLRHVVVTSVTRDDLPDGGSGQFARTIEAVHEQTDASVELLVPDFQGRRDDIARVLDAGPEVFNHNVETVPRLYHEVRPAADYARSLAVLAQAAGRPDAPPVKSGIMLGLGERDDEVETVLRDLLEAGCRLMTIGQYLAPSKEHHSVVEFATPQRFERLRETAERMGFDGVASGPFVRSSYHAAEMAERFLQTEKTDQQTD